LRDASGSSFDPEIRVAHHRAAISSLMRAANSSRVLATGLKPSVASPSLTSGRATLLAISRESSSTISFGVPAGATMPVSVSASCPLMPCSAKVGTSGICSARSVAAMPIART
jgi:hypothetical protein